MKFRWLAAAAFCFGFLAPTGAHAQTGCGKAFTAKYHSKDGVGEVACDGKWVRAEIGSGLFYLADVSAGGKSTMLMEPTREYYEYLPGKDDQDEPIDLRACSNLKKLAEEYKGVTCRKAGTATVAGRSTDRYETRGGGAAPVTEFFDPELGAVLKEQKGNEVSWELRDIKVGSVPSSLFRVPAGYRKVSEEQYLKRFAEMMQREEAKKKGRK